MQSPRYDQVLTGVLPYGGTHEVEVLRNVRFGRRSSRPTDLGENQWLQDRVWDTIETCWSNKPEQRYTLSVVYSVFSNYGQPEARNIKLGDSDTHNNRSIAVTEMT